MDNNQNNNHHDIEFSNHESQYWKSVPASDYILEITKTCGYQTWLVFPKNFTLSDLHRSVLHKFGFDESTTTIIQLYVEDKDKNKLPLCSHSPTPLSHFVKECQRFFNPIYPIPHQIVYRIFFDDGHHHHDHHHGQH